MTQLKKMLSVIALATMLVLSLTLSAFAADITIDGGADGSEYAAYMLLNATDGGNGKFAYTLNTKYESILKTVTGKDSQADIVAYIDGLDNASDIQAFADDVYTAIVAAGLSADLTTDTDKFESVSQGYYLIAETAVGNTADTFSLVMLDTAGQENISVETKESKPTVEKKVKETNDSTGETSWGDSADYDIGDTIEYSITGTVSSKYASYNSYYYSITDTMDKGITYNEDAKVFVVNGDSKVDVTSSFNIVVTTNSESGYANGFTASSNLKEISGVTISDTTTIVIEYTAELNEFAIQGKAGNENEVHLKYENNPYNEADGDVDTDDEPDAPGQTPIDINVVFTFGASVDKVDKDGEALSGAGFTLYKWSNADNAWVVVGTEITGVTTFNFLGLDSGKYKLSESTIPSGYNKADDVEFEIVATYDYTKDPDELTALEVKNSDGEIISDNEGEVVFSVDLDSGVVSTDVENLAGSKLPSTGGIGTTIFYIVGGVLVAAAVVLLVAKKRMAND